MLRLEVDGEGADSGEDVLFDLVLAESTVGDLDAFGKAPRGWIEVGPAADDLSGRG